MSTEETTAEIIEAAEASEDIREALVRMADAGEKLFASGLNERAIALLVTDRVNRGGANRINITEVRRVLKALPALRDYLEDRG